MFERDVIKETLKDCVATITFEKADGSMREMRCTLKPSYLPTQVLVEGATPRKENLDVLAVWDIDVGGWRSFRIDSIKSFVIYDILNR